VHHSARPWTLGGIRLIGRREDHWSLAPIWVALVLAELVNATDWAATLVGVGALHQTERNATVVLLMHRYGVWWGITLFKLAVALILGGLAIIALLRGRRRDPAASIWMWLLVGTLLLCFVALAGITISNAQTILHALDAHPRHR